MFFSRILQNWTSEPAKGLPQAPGSHEVARSQQWEVVVSAIANPSLLIDPSGRILFVNAAAQKFLNGDLTGSPISFALRSPDLLAAHKIVRKGGDAEIVEWVEKSGLDRWLRATLSPIRLPEKKDLGWVLIVLDDLTEQKRSETMRSDFVANASHELRTPLAAISGLIETLQGSAREDPAARERFLSLMGQEAQRMGRLIDDLLSLSKIELREHIQPTAQVDLISLINHTLETLNPVASENSVGLTLRVEEDIETLLIPGERDDLMQVFGNVIENAIKYGGSGGTLRIGVEKCRLDGLAVVAIRVRDWGPGIEAIHIPRLQERFYRADSSEVGKKKGTGLGLAIVKHILASHRGRLDIKSTPGEGSEFSILLPME